jgi:hypothetical protein
MNKKPTYSLRTKTSPTIEQLQIDRNNLSQRSLFPQWFHFAAGVVAALYVISPALPGNEERSSGFLFAFIATLVLLTIAQKETKIKASSGGLRGSLTILAMLVVILVGYSVALGLVSLGLIMWCSVPALGVFLSVYSLSLYYEKTIKSRIRYGK